jgi:thiol-disulfide isomerase/thioredoxin
MKRFPILLGLLIALIACTQNKHDSCTLIGHLDNIKDGTILNLIDIGSGTVFQKISVKNGRFKSNFIVTGPRFFALWGENPKYEKDRLLFWLENSKISIRGNYDYIVNAKIDGSFSNKIYSQYTTIEKDFQHKLIGLNLNKNMTSNKIVLDSIHNATHDLENQYKVDLIKFYSNQIQNEIGFYFLVKEITKYNSALFKSDLRKLYQDLPEKFKYAKEGKILQDYISLPEIPKIGEKFIDFSQVTPDNKTESISNHLGKYTLLEFWASGCGPCRGEHPKMRNLYKLYHDKGLNIIGISGDDNITDWINAIKIDSIPWLNISDLQGFQNKGFLLYGIRAIPQLILLDQNGIIVDNEIGRKPLEHELKIIFNRQNGL